MSYTDGCETSEGFIPHKRIRLADGNMLRAPVAVDVVPSKHGHHAYEQVPRRTRGGELLYALPGGKLTT